MKSPMARTICALLLFGEPVILSHDDLSIRIAGCIAAVGGEVAPSSSSMSTLGDILHPIDSAVAEKNHETLRQNTNLRPSLSALDKALSDTLL